mmetsp:Transcript_9594/g.41329  ORF Transcript_9594/g.41329 Transcript_9594/m.41329 type:complete len:294 (-) Transcript_9594:910-1791(-)
MSWTAWGLYHRAYEGILIGTFGCDGGVERSAVFFGDVRLAALSEGLLASLLISSCMFSSLRAWIGLSVTTWDAVNAFSSSCSSIVVDSFRFSESAAAAAAALSTGTSFSSKPLDPSLVSLIRTLSEPEEIPCAVPGSSASALPASELPGVASLPSSPASCWLSTVPSADISLFCKLWSSPESAAGTAEPRPVESPPTSPGLFPKFSELKADFAAFSIPFSASPSATESSFRLRDSVVSAVDSMTSDSSPCDAVVPSAPTTLPTSSPFDRVDIVSFVERRGAGMTLIRRSSGIS